MSARGTPALHLASRSPRRRELLAQIGLEPPLVDVDVDETRLAGEAPADYVVRLAREKALAGREAVANPEAVVLGADTTVVLGDAALGKPADAEAAFEMLGRLSGRTHEVLTAVALAGPGGVDEALSRSRVTFRDLDEVERRRYAAGPEPLDKAGAYGIQGRAAVFVARIEGSYTGIVGLPLCETARLLARAGIDPA